MRNEVVGLIGFILFIVIVLDIWAILLIVKNNSLKGKGREKFTLILSVLFIPFVRAWDIINNANPSNYNRTDVTINQE